MRANSARSSHFTARSEGRRRSEEDEKDCRACAHAFFALFFDFADAARARAFFAAGAGFSVFFSLCCSPPCPLRGDGGFVTTSAFRFVAFGPTARSSRLAFLAALFVLVTRRSGDEPTARLAGANTNGTRPGARAWTRSWSRRSAASHACSSSVGSFSDAPCAPSPPSRSSAISASWLRPKEAASSLADSDSARSRSRMAVPKAIRFSTLPMRLLLVGRHRAAPLAGGSTRSPLRLRARGTVDAICSPDRWPPPKDCVATSS